MVVKNALRSVRATIVRHGQSSLAAQPRTSTMQDLRRALTKAALAEPLFAQLGLNKREAKDMVERFFEGIAAARRFATA
jgi:hypothetical protein